jgi:hypothetical protein
MGFCDGTDKLNPAPDTANIFSIVNGSQAQTFLHFFTKKNSFYFRDLPNKHSLTSSLLCHNSAIENDWIDARRIRDRRSKQPPNV